MTTIALLSSICVISRQFLTFLPNIKPVTSIVIITAREMSLSAALKLITVTVMVSGALLGMGTWIPFQLIAWYTIATLAHLTTKVKHQKMAEIVLAVTSGMLFGALVSLEKLLIGGPIMYVTYWVSGLPFDLLHSVGNIVFYPLCKAAMKIVYKTERW